MTFGIGLQICAILEDLRGTKFSLEIEDEIRKVLLSLLEKEFPDSTSKENAELEAIKIAALMLDIKSSISLLEEKENLKKQIEKVKKTNQKEKELLEYLLYLLIKYENFI